ncbi:MAG: glycosyltransferase family 4 protein [Chitinophagaceae bacterium]
MPIKILILTPRIPFPLRDGGAIAMHQTIEALVQQGCEVSLLAMNTKRHWIDTSLLPPLYQQLAFFESAYINNSINPFSAFLNMFTDKSYNVSRFQDKKFQQKLIAILQSKHFDFILFESIYTTPYFETVKNHSKAVTLCRMHNIEFQIWEKLYLNENNIFKRAYLKMLTNRLKNYELDMLRNFDLLLPISKDELSILNDLKYEKTFYLPFAVSVDSIEMQESYEKDSCYHIGSMDWQPNIEGVNWFVKNVWSEISASLNGVTLYLAGKNMPQKFLHAFKDLPIKVVGEVEDFISFSMSKNIMIVPLLSGAGVRIKILEAMALGKTIISTSVGVSGIDVVNEKNILIANTANEFEKYLAKCFYDASFSKKIGQEAKVFIQKNYDRNEIYNSFLTVLKTMISVE